MFNGRKILIVEDELREIKNLKPMLDELKVNYAIAQTIADARRLLKDEAFDFLLTDLHIETRAGFEKPDGLTIIREAVAQQPNLVIVANSNDPRSDIWTEALHAGAQHFMRKPLLKADELVIAFSLARERKNFVSGRQPKPAPTKGRWSQFAELHPYGIVIDRETMKKAQGLAKHISISCILTGETGTGKEEIAKLIQKLRNQVEGDVPFIAVNCATITHSLAESLLFGHGRGAFTGANHTTNGYVAEADGGILFLDEIHTLDISIQQKLLRVIADGSYNRLGETKTHTSKFQLIAASTKNLEDEVDHGRFLMDLLTRITGVEIDLKPLRERKEDIPALLSLYATRKNLDLSNAMFKELCTTLGKFYWRGNLRQFFKALESWLVQAEFEEAPLSVASFPIFKGMLAPHESLATAPAATPNAHQIEVDKLILSLNRDGDFTETVESFERILLKKAMERHSSIGDCGKALNLPRSTLDAKRRKYQL